MRTVCYFSAGAASAVATKLVLAENPDAVVVTVEIEEEHKDNERFNKIFICINDNSFGRKFNISKRTINCS